MNQIRTRSSDEIRRDIELNRSHLGTSIDALVEKFSPGELIDQVTHLLRGSPGVKMKRSSQLVVDTVRENPVPLALIGVGIAWLARESGRDHEDEWEDEDIDRRLRVAAESGRRSEEEWDEDEERHGARERISGLATRAAGRGEALRSRASDAGGRLRARGRQVRTRGRERARRAASGFWELMEDNPLAAGAAVFGVGLVAGLSVRSSSLEDRLMGDAADTLKGEARVASRDLALKGKVVAKEAARAAREEADRQDVGPTGLAHKVREISHETREAVRGRADREDRRGEHGRRDFGGRTDREPHYGERRGERGYGEPGGERGELGGRLGERDFSEREHGARRGERDFEARSGEREFFEHEGGLDWGESREMAEERHGRPFPRGRQPFSVERSEEPQRGEHEVSEEEPRRGTREDPRSKP